MGKHSRKYEKGGAPPKGAFRKAALAALATSKTAKSNVAKTNPAKPTDPKAAAKTNPVKPTDPKAAAKTNPVKPTDPKTAAKTNPVKPTDPKTAAKTDPAKQGTPTGANQNTSPQPAASPPASRLPDVDLFGNPPLPDDSERKGRIMDVFVLIYNILGVIGAALLIGLFILNVYDVAKILIKEASQALAIYLNPNLYNKDTIDVQILAYHKEDSKEEPFTIFLQQQILKFIFNYGSGFIILFVVQLCVLLLITVYFRLRQKEHNETIRAETLKKPFIIIGLTILSGFILHYYYESQFKKKVQVDIVNSYNILNDMKTKIYQNLTTNQGFINAMLNKNITECENIMNAQRGGDKVQAISRMIFTSSVYNFYRNLISEEKEEYYTVVQKMFTGDQSIFPTDYMFYKQNVFFADDYANIKEKIYGEDKALTTLDEEQQLHEDVTRRTHDVNRLLTNLYKLPERVNQIRIYLFISLFLMTVIIIVMIVLYLREFKMVYNMFLRGVCNRVSQFFVKKDICPELFIEPEQAAQKAAEEKKSNRGFLGTILDALKPIPTGNQPQQPSPQNIAAIEEAKEKLVEAKQKEEDLKNKEKQTVSEQKQKEEDLKNKEKQITPETKPTTPETKQVVPVEKPTPSETKQVVPSEQSQKPSLTKSPSTKQLPPPSKSENLSRSPSSNKQSNKQSNKKRKR